MLHYTGIGASNHASFPNLTHLSFPSLWTLILGEREGESPFFAKLIFTKCCPLTFHESFLLRKFSGIQYPILCLVSSRECGGIQELPKYKRPLILAFSQIMSVLASINFGIYLVLSPSHAYNTFLLASIYFGEIISCTKFTKINGKPIFRALQYVTNNRYFTLFHLAITTL